MASVTTPTKRELEKVVVVTGSNTGIGLAVVQRLVADQPTTRFCLACRNVSKASAARKLILQNQPTAKIDVVKLDTSDLSSVTRAAADFCTRLDEDMVTGHTCLLRYAHIDRLYLNAGLMVNVQADWSAFAKGLFSRHCLEMFATGSGILKQTDGSTVDGFRQTFATNLLGHYLLILELLPLLGGAKGHSKIIWTSSSNASAHAFSLDDIQHEKGKEPYSSSKYATDLVSVALNDQYNKQGIYSHVTCPGLVLTNLTYGIMSPWLWWLLTPINLLLRAIVPSLTLSPNNGAEALVWLDDQDPAQLDPMAKYHSEVGVTGARYVQEKQLKLPLETSRAVVKQIELLLSDWKSNQKKD